MARRDAVARKVDSTAMYSALEQKADLAHVTEALASKAERSQVEGLRQQQTISSDMSTRVVALKDELQCKASSKVQCHEMLHHLIAKDPAPRDTAELLCTYFRPCHVTLWAMRQVQTRAHYAGRLLHARHKGQHGGRQ